MRPDLNLWLSSLAFLIHEKERMMLLLKISINEIFYLVILAVISILFLILLPKSVARVLQERKQKILSIVQMENEAEFVHVLQLYLCSNFREKNINGSLEMKKLDLDKLIKRNRNKYLLNLIVLTLIIIAGSVLFFRLLYYVIATNIGFMGLFVSIWTLILVVFIVSFFAYVFIKYQGERHLFNSVCRRYYSRLQKTDN